MAGLDLEVDDDLGEEEEAGGRAGEEGDEAACDGTFADAVDGFGEGVEGAEGRHDDGGVMWASVCVGCRYLLDRRGEDDKAMAN